MTKYFTEKDVVLPGQLLSDEGQKAGEGTYSDGKGVYAAQTGLVKVRADTINVIPVKGPYVPKRGDPVIGVVVERRPTSVHVDIGCARPATLRVSSRLGRPRIRERLGDVVMGEISFAGVRGIYLNPRKGLETLSRGILVTLTPTKIPRLIGRRGSMINAIKKQTGCQLHVGRNGMIVVSGRSPEREFAAISAIQLVEEGAHTSGLTDRVAEFLKGAVGD